MIRRTYSITMPNVPCLIHSSTSASHSWQNVRGCGVAVGVGVGTGVAVGGGSGVGVGVAVGAAVGVGVTVGVGSPATRVASSAAA